MRKYNGISRKKIMFIFGMVLIIATSFFYLNNARMDDFTSLITDTTVQYQGEGAMKDYTTDVYLKDQTPLSITIKATLPKGTLARIEETDNTIVKNETLTYSLPEQLKVEDVQANKLYLEDNLVNSIGSYEIKNNVLTMSFDEEQINTNAETELKIALVLDTDSSHITYDTNGSATLLFNNKKIVLNKYVEQPQETTIVQQIDEQIVKKENKSIQTPSLAPRTNTPVTVADDSSTSEPQSGNSVDFGEHIVSAKVSKIQNGEWIEAKEFEDGDHVMVDIDYKLPAGVDDQNTGKMNWTITINPDKKNISGYVLKDKIDNGLTIPTPLTVKKSDGTTFEIKSLPYTFPDGSNDKYTIEYQTDAPKENGNVKNTAYFSKGDKSYESGSTVGVWHRDWGLTKTVSSQSVSNDGKTLTNKWQAYITLPNKEISSVTYSDVIKNGTSSDDKDFNGEHYAILSELRNEILANIQLKDKDGKVISNSDLNVTMKFYSDEDKNREVTNNDAHVKAFEVIVKRRDGSSFTGQSLNISSYSTIADLSDTQEGIDYYFSNKGIVNGKESEASVHYTKPKKLVKQGYGKMNGSQNEKYSSGKVNTNYLSRNGKLYYRIIFTPDSNDEISFTDTLPNGTKLVETALRSDYKVSPRKDNPAERSSPEAVYYFNDNWEQYCDGDQNNTDISKYFTYSYDQSTNKVTFTFMPGYNKTDGDWQTNRNHPNGAIAVYYAVDITNDEFWNDLKNESKEYSNLLEYEGKEQIQETKVERNTPVVSKFGRQIDNTTKIEYTVNINPAGRDLDPNSDMIVLRDELEFDSKYSAYIDASSLKLYEYDSSEENNRGNLIDSSRYQVQMDTQNNVLTITLSDELACVLVYQYDFDVGKAASPRISNNVVLQGEFSSNDETVIDTTDSSAGVVRGKMSIFKVDGNDYSKTLPGAKFTLSVFNPDTNKWDIIRAGNSEEFVTNENGEISFTGTNIDRFLSAFNLYRVVETEAPAGYERNETPYYFSIYQADLKKTRQDAIDEMDRRDIFNKSGINSSDVWFVPNNKEVSMYIPNDSNSIYVKKVWVDSENKEITNHPDSINVRLMQNIKTPTGVNVRAKIYTNNWDGSENIVENKMLIVKKNGTLKITLPVSCDPGKESENVTVEGTDNYTLATKVSWWSNVVLTVRNIDSDTNLKIRLSSASGNAEYDYDRDYLTSKQVYENKTVTLNESNNWSYIWKNLPRQVDGHDCVYTLEEDVPPGYQVLYTNNDGILAGNITVTNKKLDNTELPDTGGFGTFGYYAIGALFITMTLFAIIAINKKKGAYGK